MLYDQIREYLRPALGGLALGTVLFLVVSAHELPYAYSASARSTVDAREAARLMPSREEVDILLALLGDGRLDLALADPEAAGAVAAVLGTHTDITLASTTSHAFSDSEPVVRIAASVTRTDGDEFPVRIDLVHHDRWLVRSIIIGSTNTDRAATLGA